MKEFLNEMPSTKKLMDDVSVIRLVSALTGKKNYNCAKNLEKKLKTTVIQLTKFNEYFSDYGWITYNMMSFSVIENANLIYEEKGLDEAEKVLIEYYTNKVPELIYQLKSAPELAIRFNLIKKAIEDHKAGRYYASIPQFLMIIDGAVNDYTKRQGFFAEKTDVDVWDCLVGCSNGLKKLKEIYCASRKKTNNDLIVLPYRNGILHGRDLNYDNEYVSCKCIVLLYAIHDWITNKKNEDDRKQKYNDSQYVPSFSEVVQQEYKLESDKKKIEEFTPKEIIVGKDIPVTGTSGEYQEYPYVQKVVEMFEAWKTENYGKLANILNEKFDYIKQANARPRECRLLFQNKNLVDFKIIEVKDQAILLKRVVAEAEWTFSNKTFIEQFEFGIIFQNSDKKPVFPPDESGEWVLLPWNIQGLYKI
ncbi:hypothetical protein HNP89_001772 [Methanococcus maripaludis]|uniref:Uncharacterized protein n=1 Tax=Methanococcus maripaludis TaxID=39152 RepID=A0A7J9P6P2_METMI|nr:hypothetical protein [Methanococcus maripaludis]MBA2853796.1 hypothetical protein [Methanococcus maripaludis]